MNVDRARFLLLTTALSAATAVAASASGCTVTSQNADGGTGTVTPAVDGSVADGGGDAYSASDAEDGSAACLDDDGVAPTCAGATNAGCGLLCPNYIPNYKKGVARKIADCLLTLPSCELGDVTAEAAVSTCVQNALAAACADPSAATFCTPLVSSCAADAAGGNLNQTECTDLAVGLNATGRAEFTSCIQEGQGAGYCGATPEACIDSLE